MWGVADVAERPVVPSVESRPDSFRVSVLGPLVAESQRGSIHVSGAHRRCLLALMASQPGHVVRVDTIVDTLWGDDPPPSAVKTVQSHVLRLRRSLRDADGQVIETAPGGYRLAVDRLAVDAGRFEKLVADARQLVRDGDRARRGRSLRRGRRVVARAAYVEFRETDFGTAEGVRLDELCLAAREDLADAQIASGSASAAVVGLESLVHDSPGREGAWLLLMRALYASGRQHDALGAFQRARRGLAEFGLEPGAQLSDMERRILEHDPALAPVSGTAMLAAALRTSGAMIGRDAERRALDHRVASGEGRPRSGSNPVGTTPRAVARESQVDLAGRALAEGGAVEYVARHGHPLRARLGCAYRSFEPAVRARSGCAGGAVPFEAVVVDRRRRGVGDRRGGRSRSDGCSDRRPARTVLAGGDRPFRWRPRGHCDRPTGSDRIIDHRCRSDAERGTGSRDRCRRRRSKRGGRDHRGVERTARRRQARDRGLGGADGERAPARRSRLVARRQRAGAAGSGVCAG